ncbi:MAG: hypothetical protein PHO52_00540 [Sulfuricurvum sp.]|nr:hypothetical protein [Sulfuricurvum sp.]
MINKIPIIAIKKNLSAIFSSFSSFCISCVLMDKNKKITDPTSNKAITEVNSSIKLFFEALFIWMDVITKRQNPRRFADVLNICWEVLLAISYYLSITSNSPIIITGI